MSRTNWTRISQNASRERLKSLQWDCSVVVFQFLRRTYWSLNMRATTVSSRLFARKGHVSKSWKCSWNQSLWFRIAKVYFCHVPSNSGNLLCPGRAAVLVRIVVHFQFIVGMEAKCWSDRGRVTELEYLLSKMFILSVLCCGQTRRKRSETSCKITLI